MRRITWPFVLTALVLASVAGCQPKPPVQQKVPGDPLLSSKKPIEGRAPADAEAVLYPMAPPAPLDDPDSPIRRVAVLPDRVEGDPASPPVHLGEPQFHDR